MAEQTMRAALEEAFDKDNEDEGQEDAELQAADSDDSGAGDDGSDEQIELFASDDSASAGSEDSDDASVEEAEKAAPDSPVSDAQEVATDVVEASEDAQADAGPVKPPAHWKPDAREHWAKLPPEVQREAIHHEKKMSEHMRKNAGYREVAREYYRVMQPYQQLFQAQGVTPSEAVDTMLKTAAQLTNGSAARKAKIIGDMIQEYGVSISTLDEILSGQDVPEDNETRLLNQFRQELDPIKQQISSFTAQQGQQAEQSQMAEIQAFAQKHEFFNDVREDMADLVEVASKRGVNLTLDQAYQRAVAMNPEISKALESRKANESNKLRNAEIAKKKAAASSITGSPTGGGGKPAPSTLRGALAAAFDGNESL